MGSVPGETARHVLSRLRRTEGFISGEVLSVELSVSRMAVSKAVRQLRDLGYSIDSVRGRGYRCIAATDRPLAVEVVPRLRTERIGHAFVYEEDVDSTNLRARYLAAAGAPDGLVVVADAQGGGRGRCRRPWFSPGGCNLYVSVVLRPAIAPFRVPQLSLVSALGVRRGVLRALPGLAIRIKWPNDIWIGERKLAGILCEMDGELDALRYVIVGMGINVNVAESAWPEGLRESATSLQSETGESHCRPRLLALILAELETAVDEWLAADDLGPFLEELELYSVLADREVTIEQMDRCIQGRVEGIDPDGRLRLRLPDGGTVRVSSGDAHIRRA